MQSARTLERRRKTKGGPGGPPFGDSERFDSLYQLPPLVAEQPPLSAEPVAQLRVVVPVAFLVSVNVAAPLSRFETTLTV